MNIIKIFRPELSKTTLQSYDRELRYLRDEYGEQDDYDLTMALNDIALHNLNLNHLLPNNLKKSQRCIRIAVYRNLIEIFKNDIKPKHYEMIDLMILEERFK